MMKLFCLLFLVTFNLCAQEVRRVDIPDLSPIKENEKIIQVRLDSLIANPKKYDRKVIQVSGYLNLEFEGTAIYLTSEDYDNRNYKKAIVVNLPSVKRKDNIKTFVNIVGRFQWKSIIGSSLFAEGTLEKVFEVIK